MEANKVLGSPHIQNEGLTTYIHRYMVIKKEVTKDASEDMELENLMQQLNSNNHNKHPIPFHVTDAVRLKMRVKETNEETEGERWGWKKLKAVCLTFRTKELPSHVQANSFWNFRTRQRNNHDRHSTKEHISR
jgi:hypothetical protein